MIRVDYEEGKGLMERCHCQCGEELTLCWGGKWGIDGYVVRCLSDESGKEPVHQGIKERVSPTKTARWDEVALSPTKKPGILASYPLSTALALVKARFPRAELDDPSAAIFIMDCVSLDLDPLLGEIVPVTFKDKKTGRAVVSPVITEDGWLSLATRACPDRWSGPPVTTPIIDRDLKKALLGDDAQEAWLWQATGKTKDGTESTAYGWVKREEWEKAKELKTPMGELPGNQARVRAIKRWVRETFPEARARMREVTAGWLGRVAEIEEARQIVIAEYRVLTDSTGRGAPGPKGEKAADNKAGRLVPSDSGDGITKKQRRALYATARELRWDNSQLHEFLAGRFKKEHINALTRFEASAAIGNLKEVAAKAQVKKK